MIYQVLTLKELCHIKHTFNRIKDKNMALNNIFKNYDVIEKIHLLF